MNVTTDRRRLEGVLRVLSERETRSAEDVGGIAEACFRLAVLPGTSFREAVDHLARACRLDGANPVFPYHLARIHAEHARLDDASRWLAAAVQCCPTSHRLWAHVSLLQRELNQRFLGEPYQPDALRRVGETIRTLIRKGEDAIPREHCVFEAPRSRASLEQEARQKRHASEDGYGRPAPVAGEPPSGGHKEDKAHPEVAAPKVVRVQAPGQCRWTGVHDLEIETLLEADPNPGVRDQAIGHLEEVAKLVPVRRGGDAAFATAAIQWLVRGYPVATVRRLRPNIERSRALALLDLVCELFEVEEADVPRRLDEALAARQIPAVLAALVHQRRVLWRPLAVRSYTAYRAARKPDADPAEAETQVALKKNLEQLGCELDPPPPAAIPDAPKRESKAARDPKAALAAFEAIERLGQELKGRRDEAFQYLKETLEPLAARLEDPGAAAAARSARRGIEQIVIALDTAGSRGTERLAAVIKDVETLSQEELGVGFNERREISRNVFGHIQNLGQFKKVLQRVDKRLGDSWRGVAGSPDDRLAALLASIEAFAAALQPNAGGEGEPGDRLGKLAADSQAIATSLDTAWDRVKALERPGAAAADEVKRIGAATDAAEDRCKQALAAAEALRRGSGSVDIAELDRVEVALKGHFARFGAFRRKLAKLDVRPAAAVPAAAAQAEGSPLARALAVVDGQLEAWLKKTVGSFEAYSAPRPDALIALEHWTQGRVALTLYRLGRVAEARRLWSQISRDEGLDAGAARNLAVAATLLDDPVRARAAWERYLTILCTIDAILGSPRPHAVARAALHRELGDAYAPSVLAAPFNPRWDKELDYASIAAFLSSGPRMQAFLVHKRLEWLNDKLDFASPSLVLGVERDESPEVRKEAAGKLSAFMKEAAEGVPAQVREAFGVLCARTIGAAEEACGRADALTAKENPAYRDERPRNAEWVKRLVHLLFKIFLLVRKRDEIGSRLESVSYLGFLGALERLPIGLSPRVLRDVVLPLAGGDGEQADGLIKAFAKLREHAAQALLAFIFDDGGEQDAGVRARRRVQYERLVHSWASHPELEPWLDLADDPQPWYREAIETVMGPAHTLSQTGKLDEAGWESLERGKRLLREFSERYPACTGPARSLAQVLLAEGTAEAIAEARQRLETAVQLAFSAQGRKKCEELGSSLALRSQLERGEYREAVAALRKRAASSPGDLSSLQALVSAYQQWIHHRPTEGHRLLREIAADFDRWLAAPDVKAEEREKAVEIKRSLMVEAAQSAFGKIDSAADFASLAKAMEEVVRLDETNVDATHCAMTASFQAGGLMLKESRGSALDAAWPHLIAAERLARALKSLVDERKTSPSGELNEEGAAKAARTDKFAEAADNVLKQMAELRRQTGR